MNQSCCLRINSIGIKLPRRKNSSIIRLRSLSSACVSSEDQCTMADAVSRLHATSRSGIRRHGPTRPLTASKPYLDSDSFQHFTRFQPPRALQDARQADDSVFGRQPRTGRERDQFVDLRDASDPVAGSSAVRAGGCRRVRVPRHHGEPRKARHHARRGAATADEVFMPLTMGGGIRTLDDIRRCCSPVATRCRSTRQP